MKITAKLFKNEGNGNQKAYGSITVEGAIAIQIRVMEGKNGAFVSFPNRKLANGEYKDVAFPITKEARQQIIDLVLGEYEKLFVVNAAKVESYIKKECGTYAPDDDLEDEFPFKQGLTPS